MWAGAAAALLVTVLAPGAAGAQTSPSTTTTTAAGSTTTVPLSTVTSVYVLPFSWSIKLGETKQFMALGKTAGGSSVPLGAGSGVVWTSSNPAVATVNGNGMATSHGGGTTVITANLNGVKASSTLTVHAPVAVASLLMAPASVDIGVGGRATLTAVPLSASGIPVAGHYPTFTSSRPGVVAVYGNGTVIGLRTGTALITATVEGKTTTSTVTVHAVAPSVASPNVSVLPEHVLLQSGQYRTLSVRFTNPWGRVVSLSGKTVTVESSDPAVARVIPTGSQSWVVEALKPGIAQVVVTVNGVRGVGTVYVANPTG